MNKEPNKSTQNSHPDGMCVICSISYDSDKKEFKKQNNPDSMCVTCSIIPNNESNQSNHNQNIVRDNSCNIILSKENSENSTNIKPDNNLVISNDISNQSIIHSLQNNTNSIPGTFMSEYSSYPKTISDLLTKTISEPIPKTISESLPETILETIIKPLP